MNGVIELNDELHVPCCMYCVYVLTPQSPNPFLVALLQIIAKKIDQIIVMEGYVTIYNLEDW